MPPISSPITTGIRQLRREREQRPEQRDDPDENQVENENDTIGAYSPCSLALTHTSSWCFARSL